MCEACKAVQEVLVNKSSILGAHISQGTRNLSTPFVLTVLVLVYKSQTKEDPSGELRSKMVTAINYAPIATMHSKWQNQMDFLSGG